MPLPPKNIKILVVDDQSLIRNIVKDILSRMGYSNIKEAEDGEVAISLMKQEKFDLVILDWNMPRKTGIETLREARKLPGYEKIPIIMLTAETEKEKVIAAIKEGVTDYIVKPFKPTMLIERLEKCF